MPTPLPADSPTVVACAHGKRLRLGRRTLIMGILNVTPDSFSDGGRFAAPAAALAHADRLLAEGADILDIGAESTRPGHRPVDADEELRRLLPVIAAVAAAHPEVPISVDTYKAAVAEAAVAAGAAIINDVWGFQRDPAMAAVAARSGAGVVLMHQRGDVGSGDIHAGKDDQLDVLADAEAFFEAVLAQAAAAGVARDSIVLDPGVGFGKTQGQNLALIGGLGRLRERFGLPVLLGASRKSFIGQIVPSAPDERLPGSLAAHVLGIAAGAGIVRVHDVAATVQAARVAEAVLGALPPGGALLQAGTAAGLAGMSARPPKRP